MSRTTERDFQRRLDETPDDQAVRLAFADYLEEQGSVRALGYRALGRLNRVPFYGGVQLQRISFPSITRISPLGFEYTTVSRHPSITRSVEDVWGFYRWHPIYKKELTLTHKYFLPYDWWRMLLVMQRNEHDHTADDPVRSKRFELENRAAVALSKLSPKRQLELSTFKGDVDDLRYALSAPSTRYKLLLE